jgi:hypothetical protein
MIAVEETGIKARIAECDRLLKESKDLTAAQVGQVETVKIAAKIELVGLAAKRAAIEELVEKGKKWLGLTSRRMRLDASRGYQTSLLQEAETRAAAYKAAVEKKLPFAEVEGKVRIRRVRWDQPKPGAKTEPASSPPRAKRGSAPGR